MAASLLSLIAACATAVAAPQVGAHRGLAPGQPENTMAAFDHAIDMGVDIIELDLRTTADGQIVIMHDPTVARTTDGSGPVSALTLAQIEALDAGANAGPTFKGQRVPTYDAVLDLAARRKVTLLLDIKDGASIDLPGVIAKAKARGVANRIVLGLRRKADLRTVKAIAPDIRTLAFAGSHKEIEELIAGGIDIVRLWSDWVEADPALVGHIRSEGKAPWILIGMTKPKDPAALAALHARMLCAGGDALVTDWPGLALPGR
jgi:glycerophosphoryl diester phosphodiesterase